MAYTNEKKNLPESGDVITKIELDNDEEYKTGCDITFESGKRIVCHVRDVKYMPDESGGKHDGGFDVSLPRGSFSSEYDIGDDVYFLISDKQKVYFEGKVDAVRFSKGKVRYDIDIPNRQVIRDIDSAFIVEQIPPEDKLSDKI